jgi:hypothetical protein
MGWFERDRRERASQRADIECRFGVYAAAIMLLLGFLAGGPT